MVSSSQPNVLGTVGRCKTNQKGRLDMCTTLVQADVSKERLPQMLDAAQAAGVLNVSARTIARMCASGKLKAVKVNSMWRVNRDALLTYAGLD